MANNVLYAENVEERVYANTVEYDLNVRRRMLFVNMVERDTQRIRICEHDRIRSTCKECKGASICEHGRRRTECRECEGSSYCQHGRQRYLCRECGGGGVCQHGKITISVCKQCRGALQYVNTIEDVLHAKNATVHKFANIIKNEDSVKYAIHMGTYRLYVETDEKSTKIKKEFTYTR